MQNFFELCAFGSTIVFSRPEQFRYPALMSVAAVLAAEAVYASFVQRERGRELSCFLKPCVSLRRSIIQLFYIWPLQKSDICKRRETCFSIMHPCLPQSDLTLATQRHANRNPQTCCTSQTVSRFELHTDMKRCHQMEHLQECEE